MEDISVIYRIGKTFWKENIVRVFNANKFGADYTNAGDIVFHFQIQILCF